MRRGGVPARVARDHARHAADVPEDRIHPPETAAGEHRRLLGGGRRRKDEAEEQEAEQDAVATKSGHVMNLHKRIGECQGSTGSLAAGSYTAHPFLENDSWPCTNISSRRRRLGGSSPGGRTSTATRP